jgi:hypothetical protein
MSESDHPQLERVPDGSFMDVLKHVGFNLRNRGQAKKIPQVGNCPKIHPTATDNLNLQYAIRSSKVSLDFLFTI